MKRISCYLLLYILWLSGCTQTLYMHSTNFYTLQRGMTKQQFLNDWQANSQNIVGGTPSSSRTFRLGGDLWEVWIYSVYNLSSINSGTPYVDHQEHVAFKNGLLEEWGLGTLPITISENPNKIEVDVNIR